MLVIWINQAKNRFYRDLTDNRKYFNIKEYEKSH